MSDRGDNSSTQLGVGTEWLAVHSVSNDQPLDLLECITPSFQVDENTDVKVRSILYNILRLNNLQQFEKWQCEYSNNPNIFLKICSLLPEVYEELKLRNLVLTRELEYFVEDTLISLYFNREEDKFCDNGITNASLDDVNKRIRMVVDMVRQLRSNYIGERKPIGQEFVLIGRFVSQNIHTLKRQLRSTYNKLPWEEMEFCLVTFIAMNTKHLEDNMAYKLVLNTEKLLNYLDHFTTKLSEEIFAEVDINSKFPKQIYADLSSHGSAMKSVVTSCAAFQELYDDYEQIKTIYSLKRIESSIKLALSIDLEKEEEQGKLVIERTLQVIGESLKNTLESPNVADAIHEMLLTTAPRNLRENITLLRDSLSHSYTLRKKVELEESKGVEFFYDVQNDLKKINAEIAMILYEKHIEIVSMFLKRIIDCKSVVELKTLADFLTAPELDEFSGESMKTRELQDIKKWVEELLKLLKLSSPEEKHFLKKIKTVLDSQEMQLENAKCNYFTELSNLDYLSNRVFENDGLESVQNKARSHLNKMQPQIKPAMIEKITTLLDDLMIRSGDLSAQYSVDEERKIDCLVSNIRAAVLFGATRINGIDKFKENLEKKVRDPLIKAKEEVNHIFSDIVEYLTSQEDRSKVQQELRKKEQIYEAKLDLNILFSKLIEGSVTVNSNVKERYNDLAMCVDTKKVVLDEKFQKGEWEFCKRLVNNVRSSYQTLLSSIKNAIDHDKLDDMYKAFKEFFKSFRDNGLQKALNAAIEKILLDSKQQKQKYFQNRLDILSRLLHVCDANRFEIVDKYLQDGALQAAVEMLVLDLMEVLNEKSLLADDRLYFDGYSPILMGQTLRNYLAHGDPLADVLPCDPAVAIVSTALRFIQDGRKLIESTQKKSLVGRQMAIHLVDLKVRYDRSLRVVRVQNKMFAGAAHGNIDEVRGCIRKGADIQGRDIKGWTGLCFAVYGNNLQSVKFFLDQQLSIDIKDVYGQTPLHIAATSRSNNVIRYITERSRFNINDKDHRTLTPLHYSSQHGCQQVVDVLVEQGADVDVVNCNGVTPLQYAAYCGQVGNVHALLDGGGADVRARATNGLTPLHAAAMSGHGDVVEVLLPRTGDVDIRSDTNNTPLIYAVCHGRTVVVQALLANGADVTASNVDRMTPLHLASRRGDVEVVHLLLGAGAQVDAVTEQTEWTALHYAAYNGRASVLAALLARGAAVDARTPDRCTALHLAAIDGRRDAVMVLVGGGADVDAASAPGWTPLHYAAGAGGLDATKALLESTVHVNARCVERRTPLHMACLQGYGDVAAALVDAGGAAHAWDACGKTPIHYLAAFGAPATLERVLRMVADVDVRDEDDETPLHQASGKGSADVVATLLRRGADVHARTKGGWSSLHFAAGGGHGDTVDVLLAHDAELDAATDLGVTPLHLSCIAHERVAETLLRRGAHVGARTKEKWTPLHFAAQNGRREIARKLLRRGADVDAATGTGMTPLHLAAQKDLKDVAELLVQNKASVDVPAAESHTALMLAVCHNHVDMAGLLAGAGADVDARTDAGWTALHVAAHEGHHDAAATLLTEGAHPDALDRGSETPLHMAACRGHSQVVDVLLVREASLDVQNKFGWTPLHYAAAKGHDTVAISLVNKGASSAVGDRANMTPLHYAAKRGHSSVVETLLHKDRTVDLRDHTPLRSAAGGSLVPVLFKHANVDARNDNDETPLHLAASNAHLDAVTALLDGGADVVARSSRASVLHTAVIGEDPRVASVVLDRIKQRFHHDPQEMCRHVNATDKDGDSPLICAAMVASVDILKLLLECGANVNAQNNGDVTALHVATFLGSSEMVRMLLDCKANANIKGHDGKTPKDLAKEKGYLEIETMLTSRIRVAWDAVKTYWWWFWGDKTSNTQCVM